MPVWSEASLSVEDVEMLPGERLKIALMPFLLA